MTILDAGIALPQWGDAFPQSKFAIPDPKITISKSNFGIEASKIFSLQGDTGGKRLSHEVSVTRAVRQTGDDPAAARCLIELESSFGI